MATKSITSPEGNTTKGPEGGPGAHLIKSAAWQIDGLMDLLIAGIDGGNLDSPAIQSLAIRTRDLSAAIMWATPGDTSGGPEDLKEARRVVTGRVSEEEASNV